MIMKKSYNSSDEEILPELLLPKFSSLAASDDSGIYLEENKMDTISDGEATIDPDAKKRAKEIDVIEIEWENAIYSENDRIVRKYFQIACVLVAGMMMMCYGLVRPASGFLIPQLEDPEIGFGIDKDQGSWLASIYVVGSLSGSLCGGWQCGKFGRKKSLVIDCLLFIIGTVSSALAPNFYVLLFSRWLLGHASTSQQVTVPIYVSEISQPQMRTITGPFAIICYACGFAGGYIFGAAFSWRYALGVCAICPVLTFIFLFFCPESPVWLLTKEKNEEAKLVLERLRGWENQDIVVAEYNRISTNLKIIAKESELNKGETNTKSKWYTPITRCLSLAVDPTFIKPFAFLCVIFCLALEWGGFPALAFYMVPLLENVELPIDPYWAAAMVSTFRALLCIVAPNITWRFKRRPIYLACCATVCTGTLTLSWYCYFNQNDLLINNFPMTRWIPILSILICYIGYSFGYGSVVYILQGELLPAHARSFGCGLLGILDNLSMFVSTKMVQTWFELLGIHGTFFMYSLVIIFVAILSYFFMPETSGMTLEEIEQMYRKSPSKSKQKNLPATVV